MKKKSFLILLPALLLASCVETLEDSPVAPPSKKITFQTAKFPTSRASWIQGVKFEYDHFVTHAWSDAVADPNAGRVFMNHQKVTLSNGEWAPTKVYYWPSYSTVDFISYYPENEAHDCPTVAETTLIYDDYDVSGDKALITTETNDLMYANKAVGYGANVNIVTDNLNSDEEDSGYTGVPTLFNHALAQLEIRVLVKQPDGETESHWEAVINHAKLTGYYTKGDLTLSLRDTELTHGVVGWTPTTADVDNTTVGWSNDGAAKEHAIVAATGADHTSFTVNSKDGTEEGYIAEETRGGCRTLYEAFVLPQTLGDGHMLELQFTINKYRGDTKETSEADDEIRYLQLKTDDIPVWGMNQRIVYTIIIDPAKNGKILCDPAIVDWQNVGKDKDADDFLTPRRYFALPSDEQWNQSNVWYAMDNNGEVVAEIAKELVYYVDDFTSSAARTNRKYYQVVSVYPVTSKQTSDQVGKIADVTKGLIAQVKMSDETGTDISAMAGGTISMYPRHQQKMDGSSISIGGDYVIKSMTLGDHANYEYVFIDKDGTLSLDESPGAIDIELPTKAYTVADYDGNKYPVVKVGASYWLRENLKATTYSDGTTVKNYADATERDKTTYTTAADGAVCYYERQPMYKDSEYGRLYNYLAASGAEGENGNYSSADAWFENSEVESVLIQKDMYGCDETNLSIAPEGWHIVTVGGWYGCYDEKWDDEDYIRRYIGFDFSRAMNPIEGASLPGGMKLNNISGLSIIPVPADGSNFTFNGINDASIKENQMEGVVIPYWNNYLNWVRNSDKTTYWYPNPACYAIVTNHNVVTDRPVILTDCLSYHNTSWGADDKGIRYYKEAAKLYLPIRCVRNTLAY